MKKEIKKLKDFKNWFNKYISRNFGEKCPDFTWGCAACRANFVKELFDDFVNDLIETENWHDKKTKVVKKKV